MQNRLYKGSLALTWLATGALLVAGCTQVETSDTAGQEVTGSESSEGIIRASFNDDGSVNQPENWREWVFVGAPLTPNALNGGAAPFPEFHNVYIEPSAYAAYSETGEFPEGTQIAKELTTVRDNNNAENGSSQEVSGVGYFEGEFVGLELTVKDSVRFKDEPGGWAYFSFGHKAPPYEQTATAMPTDSCNACHAESAGDDFVFTQFYPVLRAAKPQ
ncbi:cytochrome P460 family protein [Parasphingorhabdus sp. DH2-15]|uniref:cytochrome P460 family protein n=1 Tax=Parasphingorhabdus sp. DH2-15 TaxID=3444112 RepID=UPI003F6854C0